MDEQTPQSTEERLLPEDEKPRREPVFNLPAGILLSLIVLAAIYFVQTVLLSPEMADWMTIEFGFSPIRYAYPLSGQGYEWLWTPVTYSLLHGSLEHLAFNGLWLAAFGTPVLRRIGLGRFLLLWAISSAAGAALHTAVNWGQPTILIGASGAVSAFMGAACRFAFGGRARQAASFFGYHPPRLSILEALKQKTVRVFILVWFVGNLVVAFGIPLFGDVGAAVAWDAHIGGFLLGFLGFGLFDPVRDPRNR